MYLTEVYSFIHQKTGTKYAQQHSVITSMYIASWMNKLSMVYSHEEILYNKVYEHTSAHKQFLKKEPIKRGQILPPVLHNVS